MLKRIVSNGVEWVCMALMVVLSVDLLLGVFSRYVLVMTFTWYDEIARSCFVWLTLLGAAVGVKRHAHFRLHLFVDRLPPALQKAMAVLLPLVVIAFAAVLIQQGLVFLDLGRVQQTPVMGLSEDVDLCRHPDRRRADDPLQPQATVASAPRLLPMITITIGAFVALLILAVPVAFAVGMAGFLGLWWSGAYPLAIIVQQIFLTADSFVLLAIPLFVLAGALMETGGIAVRLVRFAQALVGWIRGGLAMAVVVAEYIFSGISGSTIADVSAIGATMIPPLTRAGYEPEEAVSVVSSASAMGILVPPCILMIIIGAIANVSVAALFAGGFIPALVLALVIMAYIYVGARRRGMVSSRRPSLREIGRAFVDALIPMGLPIIIFGGILGGVFTPTEAAAVAVLYAAIAGLFVYKEISWSALPEILLQSAVITASVCFLLGTAAVVAWILTVGQVPAFLAETLTIAFCRADGLPDSLRDPVHPARGRDRGTRRGGDPSANLPARREAVRH